MCFKYLCCGPKVSENKKNEPETDDSFKSSFCSFLIVIASFIINVTVEGSYNVWSVIYSVVVREFRTTRSDAAWAGSVLQSTPSLFGPFANALVSRFGCRTATLAGAFVASFGWLLASYSKNVLFLSITFGLIGGFGLSLAYIPSLYIVAFYYQRRLTLASSIAVAGSGVGAFIYAPLTDFLTQKYNWSITVLIFACLFLQMLPCGLLFTIPNRYFTKPGPPKMSTFEPPQSSEIADPNENMHARSFKSYNKLFFKRKYFKRKPTAAEILLPHTTQESIKSPDVSKNLSPIHDINIVNNELEQDLTTSSNNRNINSRSFRQSGQMMQHHMDRLKASTLKTSFRLDSPEEDMDKQKYIQPGDLDDDVFIDEEDTWVDFSILKNGVYVRFCIQSLLVFLAYDVPLVNMPGFAISEGINSLHAAFLLSIFGVSNTVGQIFMGWLSGMKCCNNIFLFTFTTLIAGIATVLVSYASSYLELAIYCVVYGIFISANFALPAVIMVDALGVDYLNDAFGICSITQGLAILLGPPIGGYFYDMTGDFKLTYIAAGCTIVVSTIPFTLEFISYLFHSLFKKCRSKKVTPIVQLSPSSPHSPHSPPSPPVENK